MVVHIDLPHAVRMVDIPEDKIAFITAFCVMGRVHASLAMCELLHSCPGMHQCDR